jgi:adenylylsulfate reductase subunit B
MSILIDSQKCKGCGKCRQVCPGNLLQADNSGKTVMGYPKDCWGCTSCVKECDHYAINYYLGADIGGRGSLLHVRRRDNFVDWIIVAPDGGERVVTIDKTKANAY